MWLTIGVGAAVLLVLSYSFDPYCSHLFDHVQLNPWASRSRSITLPPYGALGLGFCHCMQSVGTILIVAMLITPAATAYLYTNSLWSMMLLSSS